MSYDGHSGGYGVAGERVFEGVEVCVLKCREELTFEGSVKLTTIFRVVNAVWHAHGGAPSR